MKIQAWAVAAALILGPVAVLAQTANWEPAIRAFEKRDAEHPPVKDGILFVGSSSIRFWKTDTDFPNHKVINRGFGGSQTSDVLEYLDRIVLPYAPRLIVFYEGDNDVAFGKTPDQVVADTTTFLDRVHDALPDTRIVYISIKPSLARWNLVDQMRDVNSRVQKLAVDRAYLDFVDVDTPMLGKDGKPRKELFIADGLHMNAAGYAIWDELIRPYLDTADGE